MTKETILSFIRDVGIVPVVRTTSAESAIRAIEAIYNGGIRAAEITMTVPGAVNAYSIQKRRESACWRAPSFS
jgi:2-dehydro-3-deoxyphosphogluconate aldolase/(4S)-4-hydroxy-2-oxoglutarate aldolase